MGRSLTVDVVRAVADREGASPSDLGYVMEDHVNTDALDRLPAKAEATWSFSFEVPGHEVTVTSDGAVVVDGVEAANLRMSRYRGDGPVSSDASRRTGKG